MDKKITEKIAWPKYPLETCTSIEDNEWGYLVFFNDKSYEFLEHHPSEAEIVERWDYMFKHNAVRK